MEAVIDNLPTLLDGAWVTAAVSLQTIVFASILGLALLVCRLSTTAPVSWFARAYIDVFQNTPYLTVVLLLYFGLPELGIYLGVTTATVIGLTLYSAAYVAEALRGGVSAIPTEQLSGAFACGLSATTVSVRIILPQALVYGLPATTNQWVRIIMNSTVLSVIGGVDLLDQTRQLASETFQVYAFYAAGAVGYWLMAAPLTLLMRSLESRPAWRRAQIGVADRTAGPRLANVVAR